MNVKNSNLHDYTIAIFKFKRFIDLERGRLVLAAVNGDVVGV